jgi:hypothetical protein
MTKTTNQGADEYGNKNSTKNLTSIPVQNLKKWKIEGDHRSSF